MVSAAPMGERVGDALTETLIRCGVITREQAESLVDEAAAIPLYVEDYRARIEFVYHF